MRNSFDQIINRFNTNSAKWDELAEQYGREVIALSVADMDIPAPKVLVNKMVEMARHGIYGYTDLSSSYYAAVQDWYKRMYDWEIPREWIVFSPRIVQAVSLIIQNFLEEGDKVLVHTPSYGPITNAVTLNNRTLIESPLLLKDGRYEIDFEDTEAKMKAGVKVLLFVSPHNPTGRVWTKVELKRLGELCVKYNVLLISDDIHSDFTYGEHRHTFISNISEEIAQHSIICTSPAKTFNLASLEIANIIIPNDKLRTQLQKNIVQAGIHNPTFFAVPALEVAYTQCDVWLKELKDYVQQNMNYVKVSCEQHLPKVNTLVTEGTYLMWLDARKWSEKESDLKKWILDEAKVALSFGSSFGNEYEGFIRINVGTPRPLLEEGLRRIAGIYQQYN
ncbi:MalY/PatB family protein [Lederbergia graminis]|uniref:cysteine-S-conjugate beta-lyase n=1 Tax=Lederbergia graminis TaxID=735518 RepID=A0ABW0LK38_9BACI